MGCSIMRHTCEWSLAVTVWSFCISLTLVLISPTFVIHTFTPFSSGLSHFCFSWWMKEKISSFRLAESLRSFVSGEIRKFIKCAPAEELKSSPKCVSFIFIHEALESGGDRVRDLGTRTLAHSQSGPPLRLPLLICLRARPSQLPGCAVHY